MTGLEAIAEKLQEQKKKQFEEILSVSGSSAISKNDYNVTIVDNVNPATSLIFKGLDKPKYDETELLKAVNVTVTELAPNIPTSNLDLVPKPIYDAEVTSSNELRIQNTRLQLTIDSLNVTITDLRAQVQTEINNRLTIEQTNDALTNQLDTLNGTIADFTGQISTSLQKSVDESILRASLQSQNTGFKAQIRALIKQIDSLNSIIEGLQAQLGALQQQQAIQQSAQAVAFSSGAEIINEVGLVKFTDKGNNTDGWILAAVSTHAAEGRRQSQWKYGESIEFTNNDKFPITINITTTFDSVGKWFNMPQTNFIIAPGATKTIKNTLNKYRPPLKFSDRQRSSTRIGNIVIDVTRQDNSKKSKSFKTVLKLQHPDSYPGF
jgi:TolA-binding protein